ncbi:hypothetical protein AKJ63_02085 [candidate division MSBL1 archaeon SCGC-AAA259D18]|uniref:CDP-archaeol synthase n=1 Tax=candidate division MSBL1 archaeon SCGC-AAA259D18 TaxID=1698262 RepID=A0A133U9S5_9EURY|nr:hypothetical protein AKJ63_02085 [candidate division MSBL1 archaeon SCGC-AAA259D18]
MLQIIYKAIWFVLPAYVANATPVMLGGGPPIDGGRKFWDGNRVLGNGKTIQGFVLGFLAGSVAGFIQIYFWLPYGDWIVAIFLPLGALFGDLFGSFVKRRLGLRRGKPLPVLDQLDFVLGALFLASVVVVPELEVIIILLVVTPFVHLGTNFIGFRFGVKSEPY